MRMPPASPICSHGADPAGNPVGCPGVRVPGHTRCLAHLDDADRDAYLATLAPGADLDLRGTPFTGPLLQALLQALHDRTTQGPHFGNAHFGRARFSADARFSRARFSGSAVFDRAGFAGRALFDGARFDGTAHFDGARFAATVHFDGAQFSGHTRFRDAHFSGRTQFGGASFSDFAGFGGARFSDRTLFDTAQFFDTAGFSGARFSGTAEFGGARFSGRAHFERVLFSGDTRFGDARFSDLAHFEGARFAVAPEFGPIVCEKRLNMSGAVFEAPVTLEIAAREVRCHRTRWESTATLRLRHAAVDLAQAVLSSPVAVTSHPTPFTTANGAPVDERLPPGSEDRVRVISVRGVDAAHLVLTDTDLSDCLFTGAFHLDQLRLEGRTVFAPTPAGLHRHGHIWPCRWTRRRTLAEEHHWRAQSAGQPAPAPGRTPSPRTWRTGPHHSDPAQTPGPQDVAATYRQLRKAFEDGKNEPGAADFYYGEMEMRRHDRTGTPPGERGLLFGYWLLSGYGLRASRALGWLLAAMAATILIIMGLGLPGSPPKQIAAGTVPAGGGPVTLTVDKQDPQLTLPVSDRFTARRFDTSLQVVLNSVVFRSSGQDLTTWGTYTEMASRFTEPVLLALAALAIRGRIKR
jgi:Pentapeptide repeats (9 copies)